MGSRFIAVVFAVVFGYFGIQAFRFMAAGPGRSDEQVIFIVTSGMTFNQVANKLQEQGLIIDAFKMRILGKITAQDSRVKRGEYALNRSMTPQQILGILVSGKSIQYPVTIPEGSNVFEIAQLFESRGLFSADEFLKACRDKALIQELLGVNVSSLEGYLYPETYNVTKYTSIHEVLRSMVQNFKNIYSTLETQHPDRRTDLSRHELVTLASVVEKETGAPEERTVIASVFYNRLDKKMKLQSDPTIIYGIWDSTGQFSKNIRKADITRYNRYNTYTVPRLPFGPIANPGREALAAVMKPAKTEYFYFVSRNDGTHIFTKTYQDHNKAVRDYQMNPAARAGKSWRDLKKREAKN